MRSLFSLLIVCGLTACADPCVDDGVGQRNASAACEGEGGGAGAGVITERVRVCPDTDGDGFGDPLRCEARPIAPPGWVHNGTDCVDVDPGVYPGAALLEPNLCTLDVDGDGYGDDVLSQTYAAADDGTDCFDAEAAVFPGAANRQQALCTVDRDADGWGAVDAPARYPGADAGTDCDDTDAAVDDRACRNRI